METRRRVLATVAGAAAIMTAAPGVARAWTTVSAADVGLLPSMGVWAALAQVTDGTDPSAAIASAPVFTPAIRALAGTEVSLAGYLNAGPWSAGEPSAWLLSRETFHCPNCYPFGRGSLSLALVETRSPPTGQRVRVTGRLALVEAAPAFVHFRLENARLI